MRFGVSTAAAPSGGGRSAARVRWIEAHAGWRLIVDVLEAVWPIEFGSLDKETKAAVINITEETLFFADTKIPAESNARDRTPKDGSGGSIREGVHNEVNYSVNRAHVAKIASMRLTIAELNEIMARLDRRLLYEIERMPNPSILIREEAVQLRKTIEGLQTWRRELTRRLRQADYLKGEAGTAKRQASGARVDIPGIPLSVRRLPEDEKRDAICVLALEWSARRSVKSDAAPLSESDETD